VCDPYQVPLLSYRAMVIDNITKFKQPGYSPFWPAPLSIPHVDWMPHAFIAEMISYYISEWAHVYTSTNAEYRKEDYELPPLMFSVHANESLGGECDGPLTVLSSMANEHISGNFTPFQNPNSEFRNRNTNYYQPWRYIRDLPHKPHGWIVSSMMYNPLKDQPPTISFPVHVMTGEVSVTYLSTYENAGVFEMWLSYADWSSNGGARRAPSPSVLGCCNTSKRAVYPSVRGGASSASKWVDTLNSAKRVSQLVIVSAVFSYSGVFVLNIRHVWLGEEEVRKRGGDKIKILGVRTC
jgi:hypothetical protein